MFASFNETVKYSWEMAAKSTLDKTTVHFQTSSVGSFLAPFQCPYLSSAFSALLPLSLPSNCILHSVRNSKLTFIHIQLWMLVYVYTVLHKYTLCIYVCGWPFDMFDQIQTQLLLCVCGLGVAYAVQARTQQSHRYSGNGSGGMHRN